MIYFNTAENEIAGYLYFNEDVNNLAYTSTLNNLYDKNLYLPLNVRQEVVQVIVQHDV